MLKYIPVALGLFCASEAYTQSRFIPQNSRSVFCASLSSLSKKMDVKSLKNYAFLTRDTQQVKSDPATAFFYSFISDPTGNGIDLSGKIFQFSTLSDTNLDKLSLEYSYLHKATQYYIVPIKDYSKAQNKMKLMSIELGRYMKYEDYVAAAMAEAAVAEAVDTVVTKEAVISPKPELNLGYNPVLHPVFSNHTKKISSVCIPEKGFTAVLDKNTLVIARTRSLYTDIKNYRYSDYELDSVKAIVDSVRFSNLRKQQNNIDRAINEDEIVDDTITGGEELYSTEPYYDYYSNPTIIAFVKWRIARDSARWMEENRKSSEVFVKACQSVLNTPANQNLETHNVHFRNKLNESNDVFYFMNLENIWAEQFLYGWADKGEQLTPAQKEGVKLLKYIKNAYTTYDGNFEKGQLNFHSYVNPGDSLKSMFNTFDGEYLNYTLLNTIPVEKPMAVAAAKTDANKAVEWYFKMMEVASKDARYIDSLNLKAKGRNGYSSLFSGRFTSTALNVAYNMLDPKLLNGTLKGGILTAVTGIREYTSSYESYEIDEEGNYVSTKKETKRQMPAFVVSSVCANSEVVKRIMEPFVKFGYARLKDSGYVLKFNEDSDLDFKLILKDGLIVFTNDPLLINKQPVFDKLIVSGSVVNSFNKKTMYVKIDNNVIIDNMKYLGFWGLNFNQSLEKIMNSAVAMEMWSGENTSVSEGYISFKNKDKNSLIEIFDIAEIMFRK